MTCNLHPASASPDLVALWESVSANAHLLAAAEKCNPADVAKVAQLRKQGTAPEIKLALDLVAARQKAMAKLPGLPASRLLADPQAVEQASSWDVAKWKAGRFAENDAAVFDLCCGAGFDTMALAHAGLRVEACDRDPVRAWMAQRNTAMEGFLPVLPVIRCLDMAAYAGHPELGRMFVHLDPARRNESGRIFNLADYLPPPEVWAPLLRQAAGGCVKLAPGVSHAELADFAKTLGVPWSASFVSDDGKLVQALLWTGALARKAPREAVLLENGRIHTLAGAPGAPLPIWGEPAFLLEPDDAIERAQLSAVLGKLHNLSELHPGLGLLTAGTWGDASPPPVSPWFTSFTVLESFSWDEKKARVALKMHQAGLVEVKTRGRICDPNALEKKLRGGGDQRLTLFVLRLGTRLRGLVTRREGRLQSAIEASSYLSI